MFISRLAWSAAAMILAAHWMPPVACAQSGETDTGELAALGGGTFGAGAHPAALGSAGVALSRYAMVLFETSFMPLGQHTIQPWPAPATVDRSYAYDFGIDFHVRIPVRERWAPYAIVGAGLLWDNVRQHTVDSQGSPLVNHYNQFNGAFHTGAGLRYYIGANWGIRPEFRVIVSKHVYAESLVGIFYVMPPGWP